MNILLTAATDAEIAPSIEYIAANWLRLSGDVFENDRHKLYTCVSGAGAMATAYHLAKATSKANFDAAIQVGICGAFDRTINIGDLVFVTSEQLGDLGAEDRDGFLDIFELGLMEKDEYPFKNGRLDMQPAAFHQQIKLRQVSGLTVNMVTGREQTVARMAEKYACEVESMEGAAFHYACLMENIPFAQIRAVSNYIEPRDKTKWRMGDAIMNLNEWLTSFICKL